MSTPQTTLNIDRASPWRRVADLILGYDLFISYAWVDGRTFASALVSLLRDRGWRVFLDDLEIPGGAELAPSLGASLRRSTALIVIATEGAITSAHVAAEIKAFGRTGRPIVPVFPQRAADAGDSALAQTLKRRVFLERRGADPDAGLVDQLETSLKFIRRARIRAAAATTVAGVLAILAVFAFVQRDSARQRAYEVELQLTARRTEDLLSTSRQVEALPQAIAATVSAESKLGMIPVETWRALWLAFEGAREIASYDVPLGTTAVALQPGGELAAMTAESVLLIPANRSRPTAWRFGAATARLMPGGRGVLIDQAPSGAALVRSLDGRALFSLPNNYAADDPIDVSAGAGTIVRSPDRRSILLGKPGRPEITIASPVRGRIDTLHISRSGDTLVVLGANGDLAWVDPRSGAMMRSVTGLGPLTAVAVSDDARKVAALAGSEVRVYDFDPRLDVAFEPSRPATQLQAPSPASALSVANTGRVAVAFQNSGAILVFDLDGRSPVPPLLGAESPVATLASDGSHLATADPTGRHLRVYDLSPRAVRPLRGAGVAGQIGSALKVCGGTLVWGGIEGALRVTVINPDRPIESWSLASPHGRVAAVACLGSGAVTADQDGRVYYWPRLERTTQPLRLLGEARFLASKGGVVAGLGSDRLVLWRPEQRREPLATFSFSRLGLPASNTTAVQFFYDGDIMIAADRLGGRSAATVDRWHLSDDGHRLVRRWRHELPSLLLVRASAPHDKGRSMYISGILDAVYRVDGAGTVARISGGILRPAGESIATLTDGAFAVSSLWGAMTILDAQGRRLITPFAGTRADFQLASTDAGDRLFVSGSQGNVSEVVLSSDRLISLACDKRSDLADCSRRMMRAPSRGD